MAPSVLSTSGGIALRPDGDEQGYHPGSKLTNYPDCSIGLAWEIFGAVDVIANGWGSAYPMLLA